jgi:hypothetical protein
MRHNRLTKDLGEFSLALRLTALYFHACRVICLQARFAALILALALSSASAFLPATRMQRAAVRYG